VQLGNATALREGTTLYLARLWDITRRDGRHIRLTDHDRALRFETALYTAIDNTGGILQSGGGAMEGSAIRRDLGGSEHSTEVRAALTTGEITTADLAAGLYRNATVDEYLIDWRFPMAGWITAQRYQFRDTKFDGEVWEVDLTGIANKLESRAGPILTRTCIYELGSTVLTHDCEKDLTSLFTIIGLTADIPIAGHTLINCDLGGPFFVPAWAIGDTFTVLLDGTGIGGMDGEYTGTVQSTTTFSIGAAFTGSPTGTARLGFLLDGIVSNVVDRTTIDIAADYMSIHGDNWFQFGKVTFGAFSGILNGMVIDIADHDDPSSGVARFTINNPTGRDVVTGSQVVVTAGCDKLATTCRLRFANIGKFGGYPWLIGTDRLLITPTQG